VKKIETFRLESPTLDELRAVVDATRHLPGESVVRVQGAIEINPAGPRLAAVTVESSAGPQ
jgi:hypothetical protein